MELTNSNELTQPNENKVASTLTAILQNEDERKTIACDLPLAITIQDLVGIELNVGFTGDSSSGYVQSEKPITAEQMASLRIVLEELMHCYCDMAR